MHVLFQNLRAEMNVELNGVTGEGSRVKGYDQRTKIAKRYVDRLKDLMKDHEFSTAQEELDYYKFDAVFFYGTYFEWSKRLELEIERVTSGRDRYLQFLQKESAEIDAFFTRHCVWAEYLFSDDCYLDDQLFSKGRPLPGGPKLGVVMDRSLCAASYLLAWFNVNKEYRDLIDAAIAGKDADSQIGDIYEWNATEADAAELIRVFYEKKVIRVNGVDANVKQLAAFWHLFLKHQIHNVYDRMRLNEKRKKDKNPFLRSLVEAADGRGEGS